MTSQCRDLTCSSANPAIARVRGREGSSCIVEGVATGTVNIIATVDGGGASTPLNVVRADVVSLDVQPDTTQDIPLLGNANFIAIATFSDQTTDNVTDLTEWTSGTPAVVRSEGRGRFTGLQLTQNLPVTITGAYFGQADTGTVTVRNARLIPGGLCVEPAPANYVPNPILTCRTDTGNCQPGNTEVFFNQSAQFVARGRFDDGRECDLTGNVNLDWSTVPAGIATIRNTDEDNAGRATAGTTPGTTNVTAQFDGQSGSAPFTVKPGGRIASNSLSVGIKVDANMDGRSYYVKAGGDNDPLKKAFCVGAYDLVAGLASTPALPAAKQVYARIRLCGDGGTSGPCAEDDFGDLENEVESVNEVQWTINGDYWNGSQCETSATGPQDNDAPAKVGNTSSFTGIEGGEPTVKGNTTAGTQPGGAQPLNVGTACVQGTLTREGFQGTAVDGATAIVLPVTSDEVLGDAVQLCNTLVELFLLGSGNDSSGAVTDLLGAVSDLVNPLLNQLGQAGVNDGLNTLLDAVSSGLTSADTGALAPLTGPILNDVVQDAVDPGVFQPVNCALGGLLQAIAGGDPSQAQALAACAPSGLPTP